MTPADVTVIIPARNAAATIGRTLASIIGQSGAAPPDAAPQIVVVDDGSTDGTAAVVRDACPGAHVVRADGVGPGAARNLGLAVTDTALVAFCDADDQWPPNRLADDLAAFAANGGLEVLLGRTRYDADDPSMLHGHHFDNDEHTVVIPHFGAATVRRTVLARTGPIEEGAANFEDYDWFLRVREVGAVFAVHDRVTMWRTIHAASTSRLTPPTPSDLLAVLQRSVNRRRQAGVTHIPQLADLRNQETAP